jgi:hypothetical protein
MEKVVDLLKRIKIDLDTHCITWHTLELLDRAITELKTPCWYTPEQWEAEMWKAYPDDAAVRILNPDGEWELMEYWRAKQLEQDLARLDKDFGDEPEDMLIVCDRGEAGPPPKDWKPE